MESIKDRINKIAAGESSNWLEKAEWREANESWLNKSGDIAFRILEVLKEKLMTQKDLAEKMNVSPQHISKIVKGNENLTLETISKLEFVLGVELIVVSSYQADTKIADTKIAVDLIQPHHSNIKAPLVTKTEKYEIDQFVFYQPSVNDSNDQIAA